MSRSKKKNLFVIFSGPKQYNGPGTRYYAKNATVTDIRSKAAKFYSFEEAKEFAKRNDIELTSITYIGQESFSDHELAMD
jgi:hypothetical protein